jgi:biotin synthase
MGAAWREVKDGPEFDQILEMVQGVKALGMESCCTLGMLSDSQAQRLKQAGLDFYNHNLDTSPEYYEQVISTRGQSDRLNTIKRVREAGMAVCSGGIIGMGESLDDRVGLLLELAIMEPYPHSVPINALVPVAGTPLENQKLLDPLEFVRMIAVARILMPQSTVRLSAGRLGLSDEAQALCFLAGANSIFAGNQLLTTPNPEFAADALLLKKLGLETVASAK